MNEPDEQPQSPEAIQLNPKTGNPPGKNELVQVWVPAVGPSLVMPKSEKERLTRMNRAERRVWLTQRTASLTGALRMYVRQASIQKNGGKP